MTRGHAYRQHNLTIMIMAVGSLTTTNPGLASAPQVSGAGLVRKWVVPDDLEQLGQRAGPSPRHAPRRHQRRVTGQKPARSHYTDGDKPCKLAVENNWDDPWIGTFTDIVPALFS